jgi:hypothetical protein
MGDFCKSQYRFVAATKAMQEEIIKNASNIEKYQPFSLLHD